MDKYTTIIFDLDGTLLNTLEDLKDSVNHVLSENGYEEKTLDEIRKAVGSGTKVLFERVLPYGSQNKDFQKIFDEYQVYYLEHCNDKTGPYDGIIETMAVLKDKGYKMAIVSNKPDAAVKELRDKYFGDYLEVAIGDKEGRRRKPYPDSVIAAMEELHSSKDECVYVGDSDVDYQTALNSDLFCISCLWGFRTKEELEEAGASFFIENPMDLVDVMNRF
ncbi:MAG: HAD family hydrolase [Butyrivibrio sp.]|nr:HAD family hydrolase [Butyrivibrio sp.]